MTHHDTSHLAACIEACSSCHRTCLETIQHCLAEGDRHATAPHLNLMLVCAEICQTSANAMLLGVAEHRHTCRACAEICQACAQSCESMGASDQAMKACADECRRCAESCRQMAA